MVLFVTRPRYTPSKAFGSAMVPVTSVPMKLPSMMTSLVFEISIPDCSKRLITSPRTTELKARMANPFANAPAWEPSNSMAKVASFPAASVFGKAPGWV